MQNTESVKTQERILGAAVDLFSRLGYNGTSTRDIARAAEVNEVTVYRYFPRKRDLFVAALEAELSRISLRADLAASLANATDARTAMRQIFVAMHEVAQRQPGMLRLVQFSALEFEGDLQPIFRKHLGNVLDLSLTYLQRWVDSGQLECSDPRLIVLAFAATVVGFDTLFPMLWKDERICSGPEVSRNSAAIWATTLSPTAD